MLQNYFKIAIRNLLRHKVFATINIVGLATGLTCCLLMTLYIQNELSFDRFHTKGDRIVRAIMEYSMNGGEVMKGNYTSTKVFPSLKQNFGEVEDGVRLTSAKRIVKYEDKLFTEPRFLYADSTFFRIFSFKPIRGNIANWLDAPKQVVLTASAARKYFGQNDPIGKTILVSSAQVPYEVTGIVEDCPANSQIQFDFLASFSSLGAVQGNTYFNANYTTYLLLKDESSIASLQQKIGPFMKKELANDKGVFINYEFEPLFRIHLHSAYDALIPNGNILYVYIIGGIALLVLLIACFTYINLSTARSMERAKEVGIRKVSGAGRGQLFRQFIAESTLLTFLSLLLSFGLAIFLLPSFNQLSGSHLEISQLAQWPIVVSCLGLLITIALFAGSYPAFVLSGFQPVKVLKGAVKNSSSGILLRKSLIVFQFSVSVFLIIATLVIRGQLKYIQEKKLGYDRDQVLVLPLDPKIIEKMDVVKAELKRSPQVKGVSAAYESPVSINGGYGMSKGSQPSTEEVSVNANPIDDEYIKVTGLELIAGTDLNNQDVLDASTEDYTKAYFHFILNESAVKKMGWTPEQAIGQKMMLGEGRPGEIKGVVRDFHFASLHSRIQPLVLFPGGWPTWLLVKTSGKDLPQTINSIAATYKSIAPHRPFEYHFMDEDFNKIYESENRTGKVFNVFAGIALLLACLGLFGLSAYTVKQKVKEIGIRKVVGASAGSIVFLISNDFLKLVGMAIVIACPIAWLIMDKWLNDFVYRINFSVMFFVGAGATAIVIALLTISLQTVKAAVTNPVKSLRTE